MNKSTIKLLSRFILLGVLVGTLWFYTGHSFSQAGQPTIAVVRQPSSPLLLQITYTDTSNPLQPRYGYSLTNAGEKPIRAYTIKESVSLDSGAPIIGTTLSNSPAVTLFLKPYEVRQAEGGLGSTYQIPPIKVELAVDLVEFADNTRWGEDTSKSGDRLDGIRAGGKAAIKKYGEILVSQGAGAVETALSNTDLIPRETRPKSDAWARGFEIGVDMVKGRLVRAKQKKGRDEIRLELGKPFDSTEGRQEP